MITVVCDKCRESMEIPDSLIGTVVECPKCQSRIGILGPRATDSNIAFWGVVFLVASIVTAIVFVLGANSLAGGVIVLLLGWMQFILSRIYYQILCWRKGNLG